MSLEKAIRSGKEHRKLYRRAKAVDVQCRNHGKCEYCQGNRHYQENKQQERCDREIADWQKEQLNNDAEYPNGRECGFDPHCEGSIPSSAAKKTHTANNYI